MNADNTDNTAASANDTKPAKKRKNMIIVILIFLGFIFFSRHESIETIDCTPEIMATKPDVVMLGAWWCTYCYQAKVYFQKNKVHYCEYDMENTVEGKRLYEAYGGGAVPILLIGKYQLSGYSEQQVEQALALLKK